MRSLSVRSPGASRSGEQSGMATVVGARSAGIVGEIEPAAGSAAAVGLLLAASFLYAFVLVRPLLDYFSESTLDVGGVAINMAGAFAIVLIGVTLATFTSARPWWPAGTGPLTVVLILSMLAAVHTSLGFGGRLTDDALEEVIRLVALAAIFVLAANVYSQGRDPRFLFVLVGLSGVAPALVALYQWAFVHPLASGSLDLVRVQGTFSGPNALGEYLALTALVLIWLPRAALPLWVRMLALVPTLAALIGTFSRTGWAFLVLGLVVLAWRRHKRFVVIGLVAAAGLALAFPTARTRVLRPDEFNPAAQGLVPYSYTWRLDNWEGLLSTYSRKPLIGYGLRSTIAVNPIGPSDAHSTAVKLLVEGGPVLLAAWVAVFFAVLRFTWGAARKSWALQLEARIVFVLWVVVAFVGLTADDPLQGTALMVALLALTGAVAGAWRRRSA
jgi:O-antigen ligase